jgi:hypothetical protein
MKKDRKERIARLANSILTSPGSEAAAIKEMIDLSFEEAKHALVDAEGDTLLRLQGEARALRKLYTQLTRPSPVVTQEQ